MADALKPILLTLTQVIIPLSIPVSAGALLARFQRLETKHLLTFVLFFLTPCLVFETLTTAQVTLDDIYKTVLFSVLNLFLLWFVSVATSLILKFQAPETAGLVLIATLTNCVNYGLPLIIMAFGKLGLDKASIYIIIQMLITNTFGVYFAARSTFSAKQAIKAVFSLPAIYAAISALLFRSINVNLPVGIEKGVAMIAQAYSPVVLAILGAKMAGVSRSEINRSDKAPFWSGLVLRLLVAPLLAGLIMHVLGIKGMLFSVLFVLASMPAAVNSVILAEKFDAPANMVSKCVLWTTLISFFTLPILITLVQSGEAGF